MLDVKNIFLGKCVGGPLDGAWIESDTVHLIPFKDCLFHEYMLAMEFDYKKGDYYCQYKYQGIINYCKDNE